MEKFERPQSNPHTVDLRTIDEGRLISPSKAEGSDVHELKLENIRIPVSFAVLPSGHFRMNGLREGDNSGLVMSGFIFNQDAKINHVIIDEPLKRYAKESENARVGEAALSDLEESLREHGAETAYAVF